VIPGSFEYHRAASIGEAARLLREFGDEARVLAGGHSLIPMMKLRMATPGHVVDLQGIAELRGIAREGDCFVIGAMTTEAELIGHDGLGAAVPLLREAALQVADPQVRNVGTVGGNVANGDPGNDMPAVMQCLDASFEITGPDGSRRVPARGFFEGAFATARADDEVLTRVRVPVPPAGHGAAYEKQKRKIGDYATAAAAVLLTVDGGRCTAASVAMTNLADRPVWSAAAGAALAGSDLGEAAVAAAVTAMLDDIDPGADNRGPVAFKRHVAGVVLRRAIARAAGRAAGRAA
jgi:aerobic carbon-monoxide dehydrogenase medium subunit